MQYGRYLSVHLPGVAPGDRGMIQKVEHQHIALPDSGHLVMIDRPDAIVEAVRAGIDQMP